MSANIDRDCLISLDLDELTDQEQALAEFESAYSRWAGRYEEWSEKNLRDGVFWSSHWNSVHFTKTPNRWMVGGTEEALSHCYRHGLTVAVERRSGVVSLVRLSAPPVRRGSFTPPDVWIAPFEEIV